MVMLVRWSLEVPVLVLIGWAHQMLVTVSAMEEHVR
jgi:hypothetical protein